MNWNRFSSLAGCSSVLLISSLWLSVDSNTLRNVESTNKNGTSPADTLQSGLEFIHFSNANSRDTYFTVHHIHAAHKIGKGRGIRVGIMDHSFGIEKNKQLYAGWQNFSGNPSFALEPEHHGYWMACVLREIAPECSIYAFNTYSSNETEKVQAMVRALEWAVANKIDILTYSAEAFSDSNNRMVIDQTVDFAVRNGIVTTFIHYDNPNNIWPYQMFPIEWGEGNLSGKPDLNVFTYDYNTLFIKSYIRLEVEKKEPKLGDLPYFSYSSTSPVVGGFVAVLKSINNTLSPQQYRDILIKTSYHTTFYDWNIKKEFDCQRVVDLEKAAKYLVENYPTKK